jgi:hypothetical protein
LKQIWSTKSFNNNNNKNNNNDQENTTQLIDLPVELQLELMTWLDVQSVARFAQTAQRWHSLAADQRLWFGLARRTLRCASDIDTELDWKAYMRYISVVVTIDLFCKSKFF